MQNIKTALKNTIQYSLMQDAKESHDQTQVQVITSINLCQLVPQLTTKLC